MNWSGIQMMAAGWVIGWIISKVVSMRRQWDRHPEVEDPWIRSSCVAACFVVPFGIWAVLLIPLVVWGYRESGEMHYWAERKAERHSAWLDRWQPKMYAWERRVPRQ